MKDDFCLRVFYNYPNRPIAQNLKTWTMSVLLWRNPTEVTTKTKILEPSFSNRTKTPFKPSIKTTAHYLFSITAYLWIVSHHVRLFSVSYPRTFRLGYPPRINSPRGRAVWKGTEENQWEWQQWTGNDEQRKEEDVLSIVLDCNQWIDG